jgi:hypothetical protein
LAKPFRLETLVQTITAVLSAANGQPDLLEGNGNG